MKRLDGKRALITGGTTGIGLETAKQFLAEGARVIVTGTNPETIEKARQELGEGALVVASDASNAAAQKDLARVVGEAFGKLDVVFINAGIAVLKPFGEFDEATFDRSIAINLKGPVFLLQALLPILDNPASVILNGSVNAHIGMGATSVYAATKAGLISLTRTLSGELISRGVRVNAVSPGPITTPLYGKLGFSPADLEKTAAAIRGNVPAGRFGEASEVAKAVVFLASDESAFIVGSELMIDGGMSGI